MFDLFVSPYAALFPLLTAYSYQIRFSVWNFFFFLKRKGLHGVDSIFFVLEGGYVLL